jgi:hypothetical protein
MWLACHTQEEIAEACGITHPTAIKVTDDFVNSVLENQTYKAAASHATDFEPPIYNIWKQQTKSEGSSHFGNSEVRRLEKALGQNSRIAGRHRLLNSDRDRLRRIKQQLDGLRIARAAAIRETQAVKTPGEIPKVEAIRSPGIPPRAISGNHPCSRCWG